MSDSTAPTPNEVMTALSELRAEVKKAVPDLDKITKLNDLLDKQDKANQALSTELTNAKNDAQEQKERIEKMDLSYKERLEAMELEIARGANEIVKKDYKDSDEYKALQKAVQFGDHTLNAEEKSVLRTDIDIEGGFTTMLEMDGAIIKKITEISAIRSVSRVRTISSKALSVVIRSSLLASTYEGEAATGSDGISNYAGEQLNAWRQTVTVPITRDLLMDSNFNMEAEILADAIESFAQGEGMNMVLGDGVKKPEGFLDAISGVTSIPSTLIGGIEAVDLLTLTGELKTGYNPIYVMNRKTLANLRTKVSTTGQFLFMPGLNGGVANEIAGFPYLVAQDMPDLAANSLSIAFGDFRRGYLVVDRMGMSIIRDEFSRKRDGIIEFTIHRWNSGQTVLPEAIKILKSLV